MPKYDEHGALLRDLRRSRHFTLDNEFIDHGYAATIGPTCTLVYCLLCRFANINTSYAFPAHETLSHLSGLSKSTIKRSLKTLEHYHLISYDSSYGRGHANIYYLLDSSEWTPINGVQHAPKNIEKGFTHDPFCQEKGSPVTPFIQEKGSPVTPEKGSPMNPQQTNIEQTNFYNNNSNGSPGDNGHKNGVVVVPFSDSQLNTLIQKYHIIEPLSKLRQIIHEKHISSFSELEKGLCVAAERATHKEKRLSYARTLFSSEGDCLEIPTISQPHPQYPTNILNQIRKEIP